MVAVGVYRFYVLVFIRFGFVLRFRADSFNVLWLRVRCDGLSVAVTGMVNGVPGEVLHGYGHGCG